MKSLISRFFGRPPGASGEPVDFDEAKKLARHGDASIRKELAARSDLKPELLYFLAEDPSPEVRREIALNTATPAHANLILARDADEEVRTRLAAKIAKLAPHLPVDEQDRIRRLTCDALEILARDQATMVRLIISETLKDVTSAPVEVIRRLAHDLELAVAAPVLEFSPILTDEDLMAVIESAPIKGALSAISRRATVSPKVSDAIAATDDVEAIAAMLANSSAQIREETLDRIIDRAPDIQEWHAPLVNRPQLTSRAAVRIARMVADDLLTVLKGRNDLSPEIIEEVARVVHRRLAAEEPKSERISITVPEAEKITERGEDPMQKAKALHAEGKLNDEVLNQAMVLHDSDFIVAALAVLSGLSKSVVEKIITTKSAKGMVALAYRAKLSAHMAAQLQMKVSRIPPSSLLAARYDGQYPLNPEEIDWQISFFASMVGER
jgi:uncharacterized protein (DUF2336 family)